jgi:hypothetical protein
VKIKQICPKQSLIFKNYCSNVVVFIQNRVKWWSCCLLFWINEQHCWNNSWELGIFFEQICLIFTKTNALTLLKENLSLFDTVRIWEFSPMRTDFDKCHNLSKRNVKLILKVLSDLEPLRGSSNKKTLYSTRSCVNWAFFGTRGPF